MRSATLIMLVALAAVEAPSQDSAAAARAASLEILTVSDTAWVTIDSGRRGTTPWREDSLSAGPHVIRLVQKDLSSWLTGSIVDTVTLAAGERRTLRYAFAPHVMVVTDPSGALVTLGDSAVGTTPLVLVTLAGQSAREVRLSLQGYETAAIPLPGLSGGIAHASLKRIWQSEGLPGPLVSESNGSRSMMRLYIAGGATIIAGVAAAYFKIRADERNGLYEQYGTPALRDETRRLDNAAAISLALTEIGFALLTYFLLVD
ncbi:MAG: PEGA domain-containing protein [Bacteroidota bacterium]